MEATYGTLLRRKSFLAFLGAQFLGALNDNLLKFVTIFLVAEGMLHGTSGNAGLDISLISIFAVLPALLFSSLAGYLADNFEKRSVLICTKSFEILVMGLAWLALRSGSFQAQLAVLFLLATQFTFFGPAKYGVIPELVEDGALSRANGLLEMSTFMAILLGSVLAGPLFKHFKFRLDVIAAVVMGLALTGSAMSFGIARTPRPASRAAFRIHLLWSEIVEGTRLLRAERRLWLSNLGAAYFWFQGALFQMAVVLLGEKTLHLDESGVTYLFMALALGIGAGSLLAGRWSGQKVELGLVPIGSLGMGVCSVILALHVVAHPHLAPWALAGIGISAGLFVVPLNALLQQRAEAGAKGRVQGAANFYATLGMVLAALLYGILSKGFNLSAETIILVAGLGCFLTTAYLVCLVPEFLVRFCLWLITHSIYKIRIRGQVNVPHKGPALLVCNHTALTDGFLVQACVQRFIRFMVYRPIYESPGLHWLFKAGNAIPVSARRSDIEASLERARAELQAGHVVCIFAEGAITRTGNLLKFKRGMEQIMQGLDAPVIPVHLDGLWGSIFSFRGGRFIWKRPEQLPYPVTVTFGDPMPADSKAATLRRKVQELAAGSLEERLSGSPRLELRFLRSAKRHWFQLAMADSSGLTLSYGRALAAAVTLGSRITRLSKEQRVGILLPPSVAGSLANLACAFAGKTSVNLNFTAGQDFMADACRQCGLDRVLSSRIFLEKAGLTPPPGTVYLEDLMGRGFKVRSVLAYALGLACPRPLLAALWKPRGELDEAATIIFSSGSTGAPKGVLLTHRNILANLYGMAQVLQVGPKDRLLGVLPFFHSLGYTGTIWFPLDCGFTAVYHSNPLDAATIGRLAGAYRISLLLSTPTFSQAYVRKCTPEQFAHLRYAVVGAEKLRPAQAKAFEEKFKLPLLEGYGCTEMAPTVALNVPDVREGGEHHVGFKSGTVGVPLPGVVAKVVDVDSGQDLENGATGLLLLKGPNRMAGYWQRPDLTEAALRDGWYVTGDLASIDDDGFILLSDRLSRFSKIGGEMVPHLKLEEALEPVLGPESHCVVSSVPDESKGERLVILHDDPALTPKLALDTLAAAELPKLWIPKPDAIFRVEAIPTLGTGKTDLRRCRELAKSLSGTKA
jgi:acyl-[acyl-carrier-protein]-phospholipid O-acyltransferase/long-chain-fatty-acid--[acyl-carrier-protein] ligase